MRSNFLYPSLWHNCVGAWSPSQDRSRSTILTDLSGYGNHGTLTNMDPGTDWVASDGKMALDFDGSNDYLTFASGDVASVTTGDMTVCLFVYPRNLTIYDAIISKGSFSRGGWLLSFNASGPFKFGLVTNSSVMETTSTVPTTGWVHLGMTKTGTTKRLWINGVNINSTFVFGSDPGNFSTSSDSFQLFNEYTSGRNPDALFDDARLYHRALTPSEMYLLASRRGIAYERAPRRSYYVAGGAPPVENRRNNMLVGCGF
jgi:hypothetical protein